jgi:hypothetical protein
MKIDKLIMRIIYPIEEKTGKIFWILPPTAKSVLIDDRSEVCGIK